MSVCVFRCIIQAGVHVCSIMLNVSVAWQAGQPVEDETEWGYTEVPVPMIELVDMNADSWHQGRGTHHT